MQGWGGGGAISGCSHSKSNSCSAFCSQAPSRGTLLLFQARDLELLLLTAWDQLGMESHGGMDHPRLLWQSSSQSQPVLEIIGFKTYWHFSVLDSFQHQGWIIRPTEAVFHCDWNRTNNFIGNHTNCLTILEESGFSFLWLTQTREAESQCWEKHRPSPDGLRALHPPRVPSGRDPPGRSFALKRWLCAGCRIHSYLGCWSFSKPHLTEGLCSL